MRDEEKRSNLLIYVKWKNPYTQKMDEISVWLPKEIILNNLKSYFKNAFNIEINENEKFFDFLDKLGKDVGDLEAFDDLISKCTEDYLKSDYYKEDCKDALDEYQMLNDLGDYEEADEYVG